VSRVSLCVIARDEEAEIGRCLDSVRDVVDEIVVVDTGSKDRTRELARDRGARVIDFAWIDDFSAARNVSIEAATGDWILVLDCDDELVESARPEVRRTIEGTTAAGFRVRIQNLTPPGEPVAYHEARVTRLFRRLDAHRYEHRIHEQIAPSIERAGGRIDPCEIVYRHHGYARREAQGASRALRNLRLLERDRAERPDDPYAAFELGCTFRALGRDDEAVREFTHALDVDRGRLRREARATLLLRLAQIALGRRHDREAARLAQESLALVPGEALALQVHGLASIGTGQLAAALDDFHALGRGASLTSAYRSDVEQVIAALSSALGR
jgi:glycosyltransferase involved in cell wall biosynthesis